LAEPLQELAGAIELGDIGQLRKGRPNRPPSVDVSKGSTEGPGNAKKRLGRFAAISRVSNHCFCTVVDDLHFRRSHIWERSFQSGFTRANHDWRRWL